MMKGWKTLVFNGALALVGVAEAFNWVEIIPQDYVPIVLACIGLANIILRAITNTPVGSKT